jgi:hypothetical protein
MAYNAATVPTSTCIPGDDCSCGRTIVIPGDSHPATYQPVFWGTTQWASQYHRRNLVESANAWIKHHRNLRRHSIRVHRDPRTILHLALWFAGNLIEQARRWRLSRGYDHPIMHSDEEPENPTATPPSPGPTLPDPGVSPPTPGSAA